MLWIALLRNESMTAYQSLKYLFVCFTQVCGGYDVPEHVNVCARCGSGYHLECLRGRGVTPEEEHFCFLCLD
jgi:hypothetical protein